MCLSHYTCIKLQAINFRMSRYLTSCWWYGWGCSRTSGKHHLRRWTLQILVHLVVYHELLPSRQRGYEKSKILLVAHNAKKVLYDSELVDITQVNYFTPYIQQSGISTVVKAGVSWSYNIRVRNSMLIFKKKWYKLRLCLTVGLRK